MGFSFDSRVRYSETGEDRKLTLNGILNYFQDCCTFHSESAGVGMDYLEKKGQVWVLTSWQIIVKRYPLLFEKIRISTWPYAFKRFIGNRNFTMEDESGELIAYANSLWTFLDIASGRPVNVDEKQIQAYTLGEKLDMDYSSRKIAVPEDMKEYPSFQVRPHHLDTNHHVNNGQYVLMAQEYLPKDFKVGQMRAEYKKQAVLNDVILPKVKEEGDIYTVVLESPEKEVYAAVELRR